MGRRSGTDTLLAELAADPNRVRQLCGWGWLTDALGALPTA